MSEQQIENEIQEKGLNAPRLKPEDIDSAIDSVAYHVFEGSQLTVCCITLKNGFTVSGESACASPENFDQEIGEKIAFKNAREKIWALEGYLLKERLAGSRLGVSGITALVIAQVAHEVNKAFCEAFGDTSQPEWKDAPTWQAESALKGVEFHLANPNAGSEASHQSWYSLKEAEGWVFGEVKDPEAKTHPCMVPFDKLPPEQQAKDFLFRQIVHSLNNL